MEEVKRKLSSVGASSTGSGGRAGGRKWDGPVLLKAGDVLTVGEVEDGIEQVLKLAYEAAENGSGEAWLFLGDLYLVSRSATEYSVGLRHRPHHG